MCISLSYDRAEMRLQRVCPSTRPFDVEQSGRHHIKCHQIIFDYIQNSVDNSSSSTQYCCWWIKRMAHVCSSVAVVFSPGLLLIIHWRPRYFIVRDSFDCLHYTQTDRMRRDCLDFLCILDYYFIWFNLRVLRIIVFTYGICVMRGREVCLCWHESGNSVSLYPTCWNAILKIRENLRFLHKRRPQRQTD